MNFFKNNKIIFHFLILAVITAAVYFGNYKNDYALAVNNEYSVNYFLNLAEPFNPHVSHLFSDIIHVFNVLLCYMVILMLSKSYRAAFLTALFFAVAPVGSNAVNEIAARGHLFTGFFALSSFLFYMLADSSGLKHNQDKHFIALAAFLFFIGVFFWPTLIVLPVLLAVYEFAKNNRQPVKKVFFKMLPFAVIVFIAAAVNLYVLRSVDSGLFFSLNLFGWASLYKIPSLMAYYIVYCFVPPFFDIIYSLPLPPFMQDPLRYLWQFGVLASYAAVCFFAYRKNRIFILAPAFFIIFLLPGLILIDKTEVMSLRYMYMGSIGVFFALFAFLEIYAFPYLGGKKKWIAVLVLGLFFVFSAVNSYVRKYMWVNPDKITAAMLGNEGLAEVYGWFLKTDMEDDLILKLTYLKQAEEALEKNKYGYDLAYDLTDRKIKEKTKVVRELLHGEKKAITNDELGVSKEP
ncbi:MAG: hypothetical protein FWG57_01520 [Endomicrobia bacterium]|nr:hypothetical protein [Endomicrobiia bacterium]